MLLTSTKQSRCVQILRENYSIWMLFITGDVSGFLMSTMSNTGTFGLTWTLSMLPYGFSLMAPSPLLQGTPNLSVILCSDSFLLSKIKFPFSICCRFSLLLEETVFLAYPHPLVFLHRSIIHFINLNIAHFTHLHINQNTLASRECIIYRPLTVATSFQ